MTMSVDNNVNDIIDDFIMFKYTSKTLIAVILLIFRLERRSKAQNVGLLVGYLNLRYCIQLQNSNGSQNGSYFENLE